MLLLLSGGLYEQPIDEDAVQVPDRVFRGSPREGLGANPRADRGVIVLGVWFRGSDETTNGGFDDCRGQ